MVKDERKFSNEQNHFLWLNIEIRMWNIFIVERHLHYTTLQGQMIGKNVEKSVNVWTTSSVRKIAGFGLRKRIRFAFLFRLKLRDWTPTI